MFERYPQSFACLRRKRRLLLNDTDDYSLYDDVESRGNSFQAYNGGFQSNQSQSLEPDPMGGSTVSLRSTSSVAWSLVTYFDSDRRNSDTAVNYYSVPSSCMNYDHTRQKRTKSLGNLYENSAIEFKHTYYNMKTKARGSVPGSLNIKGVTADSGYKSSTVSPNDDSVRVSILEKTQKQGQSGDPNNVADKCSLNCDNPCTSHFPNKKETTESKTSIPNERHGSSSEETNTRKSDMESGAIFCDKDEYNLLGVLNANIYSDYCLPFCTNQSNQDNSSFVEIASRSTSNTSINLQNSVEDYDAIGVVGVTCYSTDSDESYGARNEEEYSSVSETGNSSKDQYTFLGQVGCTSYNIYDWSSQKMDEVGDKGGRDYEYATIPDKECSELDSICSIGSVRSIGSVESIGSVDSVLSAFNLNSSADVESVLESDEAQNGYGNNDEYCDESESIYDEIGSVNENPFKDDSKQELEKDYEMCSLKSMGLEVNFKSCNSNDSKLQSAQSFPEDNNIAEVGDFEMKTLRDNKSNVLNLDITENYFSQEIKDANLKATNNVHEACGQRLIWETEFSLWSKLHDQVQKYSDFKALRVMLKGKDDIFCETITRGILSVSQVVEIDNVAKKELPPDAPEKLVPVAVTPDGNCFTRAISIAIYGTEEYHRILRTKIVLEGVLKKHRYLNENYLHLGINPQNNDKILSGVFAEFSGNYEIGEMNQQGQTDEEAAYLVETVYQRDMLQVRKLGSEMGMWQIFQASNVLGRSIVSVFPMRGNPSYRNYFNRTVYPWNKEHRRNKPLTVMWTPSVVGGSVNHFVPLLPP